MTHPIPPGTRDILPDEMRELRALQGRLAEVFERFGYGEVATPTVEYDEVLTLGDAGGGAPTAHRFFDRDGQLLAMRSDMTVPIARLVANRFSDAEEPLRFFYNARAYRAVRPQRGQTREFFQAGIELVGAGAPEGTVEVIEVLSAALDAAGLGRAVIGLGDAALYRQRLEALDRFVIGTELALIAATRTTDRRDTSAPGSRVVGLAGLPYRRADRPLVLSCRSIGDTPAGAASHAPVSRPPARP